MDIKGGWGMGKIACSGVLLIIGSFLAILAGGTAKAQGVISLPQTGQTKCYDTSGAEIACAGTGQDGEILAGAEWPNPRFTLVYCNGTGPCADQTSDCDGNSLTDVVVDNLTGLMWTRSGNLTGPEIWSGAISYITTLNSSGLCGFSDWRLPNINELESLINPSKSSHFMWLNAEEFNNIGSWCWSSTTSSVVAPNHPRWAVGDWIGYRSDFDTVPILPVRAGQRDFPDSTYPANVPKTGETTSYATRDDGSLQMGVAWPDSRFTNPDGSIPVTSSVVKDQLTGLIWARDASVPTYGACAGGVRTWQQALTYVDCLNTNSYLGQNDWRLANLKELHSLMDYSKLDPGFPTGHSFTNISLSQRFYWTSTTYEASPDQAWYADIQNSGLWYYDKGRQLFLLPVKGNQLINRYPDISVTPNPVLFGNVNVGGTLDQTITVKNDGDANLVIGTITDPSAPFSKQTDNCSGRTVLPAGTCTVTYRFAPTSATAYSSNSNIPSNDPDDNPKTVTLTGTGVAAQVPVTFALSEPIPGGLDSTNYITVNYVSNGSSHQVNIWSAPWPEVMVDAGSTYTYSLISTGSTLTHRWPIDPTTFSGVIASATVISKGYFEQYRISITLAGTDASHTVSTELRDLFAQTTTEAGLYGTWNDWCDAGSTLRFSQWTTGDPPMLTGDTRSWIVSSPFTATITYTNDLVELVYPPTTLVGHTPGYTGTPYSYTASGAFSNLGHPVEYQFDWNGDGTDLSPYGDGTQSHAWSKAGDYVLQVRARCKEHTSVVSPPVSMSIHMVDFYEFDEITSPKEGDAWEVGNTYRISWTYTGMITVPTNTSIKLLKSGAFHADIKSSTSLTTGYYDWPIPDTMELGSDYQIQLTADNSLQIIGDAFRIEAPTGTPQIRITSPNRGETWEIDPDKPKTITWTYSNIAASGYNVRIDLVRGKTVIPVTASAPIGGGGNGSFLWPISADLMAGNNCQIRVTSINSPAVTDTSDSTFILAPSISGIEYEDAYGSSTQKASVGGYVKISGYGFGDKKGSSYLLFGSSLQVKKVDKDKWNKTNIKVLTPQTNGEHSRDGELCVRVSVNSVMSNCVNMVYAATPYIDSPLHPPNGSVGTEVGFLGVYFENLLQVNFGKKKAKYRDVLSGSLYATAPKGAAPKGGGTVKVRVITSEGTSNGVDFTYE